MCVIIAHIVGLKANWKRISESWLPFLNGDILGLILSRARSRGLRRARAGLYSKATGKSRIYPSIRAISRFCPYISIPKFVPQLELAIEFMKM